MTSINIGSSPLVASMRKYSIILMGAGAVGLAASYAVGGQERAVADYLIGFWYFAGISITMLFFSALQFLTRSGWSAGVRRIAENLSGMTPFLVVFLIPIVLNLFGHHSIYEWTHESSKHDPIIQIKEPYLNIPFTIGRLALYCLLWWGMWKFVVGNSVKQDSATDITPTRKNWKRSAVWVLVYSLTITFASFDLLMSLEPHWFSTIWGVYTFSGHFVAALAIIAIMLVSFRNHGLLDGYIRDEHYHDLGKLMFAFTVFWAYIGFSQYFIIWFANIPEETVYFTTRLDNTPWSVFGILLILTRFLIPFALLLKQDVKRKKKVLVWSAIVILIAHFIDIVWIVMPAVGKVLIHGTSEQAIPFLFSWNEFTGMLFFAGVFLFAGARMFTSQNAVAANDPLLQESFEYHS